MPRGRRRVLTVFAVALFATSRPPPPLPPPPRFFSSRERGEMPVPNPSMPNPSRGPSLGRPGIPQSR